MGIWIRTYDRAHCFSTISNNVVYNNNDHGIHVYATSVGYYLKVARNPWKRSETLVR